MGIDNAHIFNHNIAYKNAEELLSTLQKRLGLQVLYNDYEKGFDGLIVECENQPMLDEMIAKNEFACFNRINPRDDRGYFHINQRILDNSLPECYLHRWNQTADMCRFIKEVGLANYENYEKNKTGWDNNLDFGADVLLMRKAMYPHLKKFGSTAMVTLCSDYHSDYMEIAETDNWTFEDLISWGKKELMYVAFEELPLFDFPKHGQAGYYDVFIYDVFEDVK